MSGIRVGCPLAAPCRFKCENSRATIQNVRGDSSAVADAYLLKWDLRWRERHHLRERARREGPYFGRRQHPEQPLASACVAFPDARRPACAMEIGDLRVERECHGFDGLNERFGPIGTDD